MKPTETNQIMELCKQLSIEAGQAIMDICNSDDGLGVDYKADIETVL